MMNKENVKDLREKIIKGINLAYTRLLITRQKENAELVFSKNGKIIRIKASELLNIQP